MTDQDKQVVEASPERGSNGKTEDHAAVQLERQAVSHDVKNFQKRVMRLISSITVVICIVLIAHTSLPFLPNKMAPEIIKVTSWAISFTTMMVALFGILITGIFVFMAMKIDRGAELEARAAALKAAADIRKELKEDLKKYHDDLKESTISLAKQEAKKGVSDVLLPAKEKFESDIGKERRDKNDATFRAMNVFTDAQNMINNEVPKLRTEMKRAVLEAFRATIGSMSTVEGKNRSETLKEVKDILQEKGG